jgi:hypothetical protein
MAVGTRATKTETNERKRAVGGITMKKKGLKISVGEFSPEYYRKLNIIQKWRSFQIKRLKKEFFRPSNHMEWNGREHNQ